MTGAEFVVSLQRWSWCQAFSPARTVLGIVWACSWEHEKESPVLQPGRVINHCVPKAHNGCGGQTEVQRHHCEVSPLQACTFASISCSAGQYAWPSTGIADEGSGWARAEGSPPYYSMASLVPLAETSGEMLRPCLLSSGEKGHISMV